MSTTDGRRITHRRGTTMTDRPTGHGDQQSNTTTPSPDLCPIKMAIANIADGRRITNRRGTTMNDRPIGHGDQQATSTTPSPALRPRFPAAMKIASSQDAMTRSKTKIWDQHQDTLACSFSRGPYRLPVLHSSAKHAQRLSTPYAAQPRLSAARWTLSSADRHLAARPISRTAPLPRHARCQS